MRTITELLNASGESGHSLSRLTGRTVSAQMIYRWMAGEVSGFPTGKHTIPALARALGVRERAVVLGFAASLGYDVGESGSPLAGSVPAGLEQLPAEAQRAWLSVGREMVRLHQEQVTPPREGEQVAEVTELRRVARKRTGPRERDQLDDE